LNQSPFLDNNDNNNDNDNDNNNNNNSNNDNISKQLQQANQAYDNKNMTQLLQFQHERMIALEASIASKKQKNG
jgi:amino acid permease